MLSLLPPTLRGILALFLHIVFTLLIFMLFWLVAPVKLLIPVERVKNWCNRMLNWLSSYLWVVCSIWTSRLTSRIEWDIRGDSGRNIDRWCLIFSNHQSWVDILVIIRVLAGKVPPYKFFIKKELLWLPLMGQCFWALDFPIMKRYSKAFLQKHPHLKGTDLETTRRSCEKFKNMPVSIMNFIEGTRYTPQKHARQASPFKHLLKPRAGGTAVALYAMGDLLEDLVDMTILYPEGVPGLWDFFCGRMHRVKVVVRVLKIPRELKETNHSSDSHGRQRIQKWLNRLWDEKDQTLENLLAEEKGADF